MFTEKDSVQVCVVHQDYQDWLSTWEKAQKDLQEEMGNLENQDHQVIAFNKIITCLFDP